MTRLLLATRSAGKLRELAPMLRVAGFTPIDLETMGIPETAHESSIEAYESFESNALAKARHFYALSGLPTLADDSGLCVERLAGGPGVRSKRWSGRDDLSGEALDEANNEMLLAALDGIPAGPERAAAYVCAAAYVDADDEVVRRGETRGEILLARVGERGFGYDPLFRSEELGRSFGVASVEEKGRVSHRARAVAAVLESLGARR